MFNNQLEAKFLLDFIIVQNSECFATRHFTLWLCIAIRRMSGYSIRPDYSTMRLGFSKLLGTLSCGKICIYLLRIHYKKYQIRTYLMMIMQFFSEFLYKGICCRYSLNCINKSMQPASVAQLDAPSDWRPGGRGFYPLPRSATCFRGD